MTGAEVKDLEFDVLDHGMVKVVDCMGDDFSIVQAARISYGKGTKSVNEDRGLIRYLMRHRHTTPFEMCEIKLLIICPIYVARQWHRHRTASINEASLRYSLANDDMHLLPADSWRTQSKENRQGRADAVPDEVGAGLEERQRVLQEDMLTEYHTRIEEGVSREQARMDLPVSNYTSFYWKCNLHNLFHFLALRMDEHAQTEIRKYAEIIGGEITAKWVPMAWEAFVDYQLLSISFSRMEVNALGRLMSSLNVDWDKGKLIKDSKRENKEFKEKLKRIARLGMPLIEQAERELHGGDDGLD